MDYFKVQFLPSGDLIALKFNHVPKRWDVFIYEGQHYFVDDYDGEYVYVVRTRIISARK